jgi:hypothetical protein
VSSQPLDFGSEFPLLHEFEDGTALVGFEDDLRFALAHMAPRGVVAKLPIGFLPFPVEKRAAH